MSNNRRFIYGALFISIIAALSVGAYIMYQHFFVKPSARYSDTNTVGTVLQRINPAFNLATIYMNNHDFAKAKAAYERSLLAAEDSAQEAQIRFNIARTEELLKDGSPALVTLKQIAADERYYPVIRATAVQEIAMMRTAFPLGDDALEDIFKGEPYASFREGVGERVAYAKLFEYATSIHPLSLSYAFAAYLRAEELRVIGTTTPEAAAHIDAIRAHLAATQDDLPRLLANPNEAISAARLYRQQAMTIALMTELGVPGYSNETAESYFQRAMNTTSTIGYHSQAFAFQYAVFLVDAYGERRADDVRALLSVFTSDKASTVAGSSRDIFAAARTKSSLSDTRSRLVRVAKVDQAFKAYLITLGWNESDF